MSNNASLPFDALRPFKSKPEEFTPMDTLPWEALAERYLRYRTRDSFLGLRSAEQVKEHVAWLAKHLSLSQGAAILDIGCGPGLYSNRLAGCGYHVTGIDIAQPFLDYAQTEAEVQGVSDTCRYRRLSMFDLDDKAKFEGVVLIQSIANRLALAELKTLLTKIYTILKPGGHFIAEFKIAPNDFASSEPAVTESISFLDQSPWSDQFHVWLRRDLTFPTINEQVNHHLILGADGQPVEYWSRFKLYTIPDLKDLLRGHGFQIQAIFGEILGQPPQATDESCFIWTCRN